MTSPSTQKAILAFEERKNLIVAPIVDQSCVPFCDVGMSVLRHMHIMLSSFRTEECLDVLLLHLDSFHHVLFLYVSKTFPTCAVFQTQPKYT